MVGGIASASVTAATPQPSLVSMVSATVAGTPLVANCSVILRAGPSTAATRKTSVATGAVVTTIATVTGASWTATCGGHTTTRNTWYKIGVINGRSATSLF